MFLMIARHSSWTNESIIILLLLLFLFDALDDVILLVFDS